ncbi:hypothetical protein [Phreatobacter oligotrophus]|jgi:hypothetical protein|uniref:Uncharacterized protein n=1 Tax=Phreatobacter oligotrophus TaxID=1122261 RepID=A0A2T4ZI57_9HYPH|nr:hypothetical protein [Phreatobacter oligotrophus]PTM61655.1 hypothetical protein C8P69_101325 [Phreatobacter oligotrophus]
MPLPLGTASSIFSTATAVTDFFKPNRSPYLLSSLFIVICLLLAIENPKFPPTKHFMLIIPSFFLIIILNVLSFYFTPIIPDSDSKETNDIDAQLKLSRSASLSSGIVCIYVILRLSDPIELHTGVAYLACLIHCAVFLSYTIFRNIQEENMRNISYFQISFMTSLFLVCFVTSAGNLKSLDGSVVLSCRTSASFQGAERNDGELSAKSAHTVNFLPSSCSDNYEDAVRREIGKTFADISDLKITRTAEFDPNFVVFIFFSILWLINILFWIKMLSKIWQNSTLVIGETT